MGKVLGGKAPGWTSLALLLATLWAGSAAAQVPSAASKADWGSNRRRRREEGGVVLNSQLNLVWRDFIIKEFAKAIPRSS